MAVNLYEAMFVVDAARGTSAVPDIVRHIAGLLTRHEAQIERIELWDERKLAYPIQRAKRGMYFLVYFRAEAEAIAEMRGTVRLSEQILRLLILRTDQPKPPRGPLYTAEGEQTEPPAEPAAEPKPEDTPTPAVEPKPEDTPTPAVESQGDVAEQPEVKDEESGNE